MTQTLIRIDQTLIDTQNLSAKPADRVFREAWQTNGNVIDVDIVKAREIHRDNLRAERKPLLEALDTKFMKALESGGDTASIVAEKQVLRDLPASPLIAAAASPAELKQLDLQTLVDDANNV